MMTDDELDSLDDADSADTDADLETEAEVMCPHCGVTLSIGLDPGGGKVQEYVEDCEVCCRPYQVRVLYRAGGTADVELQGLE